MVFQLDGDFEEPRNVLSYSQVSFKSYRNRTYFLLKSENKSCSTSLIGIFRTGIISDCQMQNSREQLENVEIEKVIEDLTPRIKNRIRNTAYQEREDLEQELIIKIIEKIRKFDRKETPGFWEFVQTK